MLSKRERIIVWTTALAVGALALDWLVLTPLLDSRDRLAAREEQLLTQLRDGQRLRSQSRAAAKKLRSYEAAGLAESASATEGQLLSALRNWSQDSGLTLASIRPDRATSRHGLSELTLQAGGEGTMRSLAKFLYRLQTARIPVRLQEVQIASRTDGVGELSVQLRLSTLWNQDAARIERASAVASDRSAP